MIYVSLSPRHATSEMICGNWRQYDTRWFRGTSSPSEYACLKHSTISLNFAEPTRYRLSVTLKSDSSTSTWRPNKSSDCKAWRHGTKVDIQHVLSAIYAIFSPRPSCLDSGEVLNLRSNRSAPWHASGGGVKRVLTNTPVRAFDIQPCRMYILGTFVHLGISHLTWVTNIGRHGRSGFIQSDHLPWGCSEQCNEIGWP